MSSRNDPTLQQRLREHAELHTRMNDYDGDQRRFADDLYAAADELDLYAAADELDRCIEQQAEFARKLLAAHMD